jgi:hypothetical protein
MAKLIQISGLPGTGKTTGLEFLDPKQTFIIDCDKKGLSWAGWSKQYNKESSNYLATSDISLIYKALKHISDTQPHIKYVAIDTLNAITSDQVMLEMKKANFDQWKELAISIYELYDMIRSTLRSDLIVFCMAHIEPYDNNGFTHWRTKFDGKKLTKLNMSGKLNYNLYTKVDSEGEGRNKYYLITQNDGTTEARSTKGVLPYKMENNLLDVVTLINEKDN